MFEKMIVYLIFGLVAISQGQVFRFDYEFNGQGHGWFKLHVVPSTWQQARMRCHAENAILASPLNTEMQKALIDFVQKKKGTKLTTIFTGIHASFSKGDYMSVEGIPLSRINVTWSAGEPDNFENEEDCLAMVTDSKGSMSDVKCNDVLPYVCFKEFENLARTDCGTTDPAYLLESATGSCYKFHKDGLVWNQAYMTCLAEGGYLAIINSEEEANILKEIVDDNPDDAKRYADTGAVLVGFHDWGEHGTFMSINSETLDTVGYDAWSEFQPDNSTRARSSDAGEFCGGVLRHNLKLNDVWCNVPTPFICEMEPNSLV